MIYALSRIELNGFITIENTDLLEGFFYLDKYQKDMEKMKEEMDKKGK